MATSILGRLTLPMTRVMGSLALAIATLAAPGSAWCQPAVVDISFGQVDWLRPDGTLAQADSLWGQMNYAYLPQSATAYLNLSAVNPAGGAPAWVIQNLPLFGVDNGNFAMRTESVNIDLRELGLAVGQNLASMVYTSSVDSSIRLVAPSSPSLVASVLNLSRRATDLPGEAPNPGPFVDPGAPEGVHLGAAPDKLVKTRDVRSVQEALAFCFTGSVARSLDWLNREHNLGIGRTAQQIYEDLVALGTSQAVPGATAPYRDDWIAIKNRYALMKSNNRIVTKVWDPGGMVDPIPGVGEEDGDFAAWLMREVMHGEDVELAYAYPGSAHIVTIVDVYRAANGDLLVDYRDDETQGNDGAGDSAVKRGTRIYKDAGGVYHFGADRNAIYFSVSESFVSEPAPLAMIVISLIILGGCRRRLMPASQWPSLGRGSTSTTSNQLDQNSGRR